MSSELCITNNKKILIVCFGGMALKMGGIPPFEFLRYLDSNYSDKCDLIFYIDKNQCWYHKGIDGISNNIEESIVYITNKIKGYEKVIFMGVSAGGYAALLFGSLCNVNNIIAFIPRTNLIDPIEHRFKNIRDFINPCIQYLLIGDTSVSDMTDNHHIIQCENIQDFPNVTIIRKPFVNLKKMRDDGEIKTMLDEICK